MSDFQVTYKRECSWKDINFKFDNPSDDVESFEVRTRENISTDGNESKGNYFEVLVNVNSKSSEGAKSIADTCVNDFFDSIAFVKELGIVEPKFFSISGNQGIITRQCFEDIKGEVTVRQWMTDEEKEFVKNVFQGKNSRYYSILRTALNQTDIVAKYMFLYNIILNIFGDSQVKVDEFIIGNNDNKYDGDIFERRNKKLSPETIFTKIRNDIGHGGRVNNSINEVRKMMEKHVDALLKYVKLSIIHDLNAPQET